MDLGLTSCDFVGDSGCTNPTCLQCHPPPNRAERSIPRHVVCAWCGNRYRSAVEEANVTQGTDCAATVWTKDGEWFVQGHYGSRSYDTDRFRFVQNVPLAPANPVCDVCIDERIFVGDLAPVEGCFL